MQDAQVTVQDWTDTHQLGEAGLIGAIVAAGELVGGHPELLARLEVGPDDGLAGHLDALDAPDAATAAVVARWLSDRRAG